MRWMVLVLWLLPLPAWAATVPAATCANADVQTAVTAATTGDTVTIPAGTCAWTAAVTIGKNITIQGAGKTTTILTRTSGPFFTHAGSTGFRLTALQLQAPTGSTADYYVTISGAAQNFRIDNVHFNNTTTSSRIGVRLYASGLPGSYAGHATGVIHDCTFTNTKPESYSVTTSAYNAYFSAARIPGTGDTVFIEDNTIDRTLTANAGTAANCVDSQYGGSYVFRFNTCTNGHVEVHGTGGGDAPARGGRYWEVYGNVFSHASSTWDRAMLIRGGTGMIFNNTITDAGFSVNRIDLDIRGQRVGSCTGSSAADGNTVGMNGYPCRDNIGRATDAFTWTEGGSVPSQTLEPAYFWNNTGFSSTGLATAGDADYIVQGRDYYEDDTDAYGRNSLTSGETRPATCTTGDGFWQTNEGYWNTKNDVPNITADGVLYKCTATSVWTPFYTPYPYPHPLRSGLGVPTGITQE